MGILEMLKIGRERDEAKRAGKLQEAVERVLAGAPDERVKKVAGFAGVLGKVSYADMDMSAEELASIEALLVDRLRLSREDAAAIVRLMTEDRVTLYSLEDHLYTRMLNDVLSHQEKIELLGALFAVAAANKAISNLEDNAVRIIAKGLLLSHREFIEARLEYREHLEILK